MKKPKPPIHRVIVQGVSVFCNICHSTCSRKGLFRIFGKRYCDNNLCLNSKEHGNN